MTKEEAQTTLRAILNENIVLDDPKGVSLATWRDRAYIAANDLARAAVAEARAPLVEALQPFADYGTKHWLSASPHLTLDLSYEPGLLSEDAITVADLRRAAAALAAKETP